MTHTEVRPITTMTPPLPKPQFDRTEPVRFAFRKMDRSMKKTTFQNPHDIWLDSGKPKPSTKYEWSVLISMFAQSDNVEKAESSLIQMVRETSSSPSDYTFIHLAQMYGRLRLLHKTNQLFSYTRRCQPHPTSKLFHWFIDAYCLMDAIEDMEEALSVMAKDFPFIKLTTQTWNSIIMCYGRAGGKRDHEKVEEIWKTMKTGKIHVDKYTFGIMMEFYGHSQNLPGVKDVMRLYRQYLEDNYMVADDKMNDKYLYWVERLQ